MCWFSCIMTYTSSEYLCPAFIIFMILMPLVTNESFILLNVSLTKAVIGNAQAPFKTEFIHSTRLVVIWPNVEVVDHSARLMLMMMTTVVIMFLNKQHTITCDHPRTRRGRDRRPRGQQTQIQSNKMRDWDAYIEELVVGHHLIISLTNT